MIFILAKGHTQAAAIANAQGLRHYQWTFLHSVFMHRVRGLDTPVVVRCKCDSGLHNDDLAMLHSRNPIFITVTCPLCSG